MDSLALFLSIIAVVIGGGLLMLLRKLRFHQDNREQNSSSLSISSVPLSSLSRPTQSYHVFPSFRGQDVRRDFFSHVQTEFQRKGITLFIDNNITRGEPIGPELLLAIRGSKMAIILLSRSYASSKWCLDELVEIMKCREQQGQTVIPIFYGVDPSDVKKLAGEFGKVFRETCAGQTEENIKRWKHALGEVATIAGYHSTNWDNEATMIKQMAKDISDKLKNSTLSCYFDGLVGMRANLVKMEPLLGLCSIAGSAYSRLPDSSQLSDFMEKVKAKYTRPCRFSRPLMTPTIFTTHQSRTEPGFSGQVGSGFPDQVYMPRSRISHIYSVDFPSNDEALRLFCMYAFRQKFPEKGYGRLAQEVTTLVGTLPLALRVMGCYLRGKTEYQWRDLLPLFRLRLDTEIESTLRFSYDDLDKKDQDFFLHIACLKDYIEIKRVKENLANKFLDVNQRLQLLADRSLIFIESEHIWMHDLLRQLARDILRRRQIDKKQVLRSKL